MASDLPETDAARALRLAHEAIDIVAHHPGVQCCECVRKAHSALDRAVGEADMRARISELDSVASMMDKSSLCGGKEWAMWLQARADALKIRLT